MVLEFFCLDTYEYQGKSGQSAELYLCHNDCDRGNTELNKILETIGTFLKNNPQEIITIIFEDHVPQKKMIEILQKSLLEKYMLVRNKNKWPTLWEK